MNVMAKKKSQKKSKYSYEFEGESYLGDGKLEARYVVYEKAPDEPEQFITCYVPYSDGYGEDVAKRIVQALNAMESCGEVSRKKAS